MQSAVTSEPLDVEKLQQENLRPLWVAPVNTETKQKPGEPARRPRLRRRPHRLCPYCPKNPKGRNRHHLPTDSLACRLLAGLSASR